MNVLIIMHDPAEGAGTLEEYLTAKKVSTRTIKLFNRERLPLNGAGLDGVISMGGPMNVYDEANYPFLKEEAEFLRQILTLGIPVLGICLGAQMIAKAGGAAITKASQKELGWNKVSLTEAALDDPLFRGLPKQLSVFQWHEDTFALPVESELLATSSVCYHQAFRYRHAYGLQFHIEVTPQMLAAWFDASPEGKVMADSMNEIECAYVKQAFRIYRNFLELMKERS